MAPIASFNHPSLLSAANVECKFPPPPPIRTYFGPSKRDKSTEMEFPPPPPIDTDFGPSKWDKSTQTEFKQPSSIADQQQKVVSEPVVNILDQVAQPPSTFNLRRAVEELAELFGDQIPTSTFRLKSNRKKYWTSEKMKPAKFLAAFEKELKKGNLDKVILLDGRMDFWIEKNISHRYLTFIGGTDDILA